MKDILIEFITTLIISFITLIIVTFLYNLFAHGAGSVDWPTVVRFSFFFAIALPIIHALNRKENQ